MNIWLILFFAIVFEVFGTTALKLSDGFTKLIPTISIFVFYGLGLFLMTLTLKKLDLGVVYAIWSGVGTALVAVIGVLFFNDAINIYRIASLALIVVGVMGLHLQPSH